MRAVLFDRYGDELVLRIGETEPAALGPRDLRIRVRAAGVNRADLLQRQGHYPPPPGASTILGLECAGVVEEVGSDVSGWKIGDRAMALLAGGGYAEEVVVDAASAMHVPDGYSDEEAAAIPETFLTAWVNIFDLARGKSGETVLIHGGGSGVGTAATTLCKLAGMRVVVTAGSDVKCELCISHGADVAINYRRDDFAKAAGQVDIVLDHIGARYLISNLRILNTGGRVVFIGSMGGMRMAELDVTALLAKRQQIIGSTLRSRSKEEKGEIVAGFLAQFGADLRAGRTRPVIDRTFPLDRVADAHIAMAADHFGKLVLAPVSHQA